MSYSTELLARAKKVKLLLLDVDGVLSDGTLLYIDNSMESKAFHTQDGFGLRLLHEAGIETGIITARKSAVVERRGTELKMAHLYQNAKNKITAFEEILSKTGLKTEEVAYMGDDWLDLRLLARVGLAVSPANGVAEVQNMAHFITQKRGGNGAVRDLCNLILTAKDVKNELLLRYTK